jgi:F-type H+-transporting ATPase subunit epsilon
MAEQEKQGPLNLEICAIGRPPYTLEVEQVGLPGVNGYFIVLPGHAPLVSTLEVGVLKTQSAKGGERHFAINGGVVRVLEDKVMVLTRTAEADMDIDRARAEAARKRGEDRLKSQRDKIDVARAEAALRRAMIRLQAQSRSGGAGNKGD